MQQKNTIKKKKKKEKSEKETIVLRVHFSSVLYLKV